MCCGILVSFRLWPPLWYFQTGGWVDLRVVLDVVVKYNSWFTTKILCPLHFTELSWFLFLMKSLPVIILEPLHGFS
jgi:hypothetical protein